MKCFLAIDAPINKSELILSLQFWRDAYFLIIDPSLIVFISQIALIDHLLSGLLVIESSLLHDDVMSRKFFLRELS